MEALKRIMESREKQSHSQSDSPLKKSESNPRFTSQAQRFKDAEQILFTQLQKTDQLFERWSQSMLKNFQPFIKHFGLLQKQFSNIYETNQKYRPSLLSYTDDVKNLLSQNQIVCLKQTTGRSEIFQLIVGLLIEYQIDQNNNKIIFYTSQEVQKHYDYFYLNYQLANTTDIQNDYRQELVRELPNLEIRYFQDRSSPKDNDSQCLVIFDLFSSLKTLYSPQFQLVMSKKLYKNILVYVDSQDQIIMYDQFVQLNHKFPTDIVQDANFKDVIFKIFEDSKLYAEKTDIIVFSQYPQKQKFIIEDFLKNTKYFPNIIRGLQPHDSNKINIFIASDEKQLAQWRYPYDNVIAVFDYGMHSKIRFSVDERLYIQTQQQISQKEMNIRAAFLGQIKPGKYFQMYNFRPKHRRQFQKQDLSLYILSMIHLGYQIQQILKDKEPQAKIRLQKTINLLKNQDIIEVKGAKGVIKDKSIHSYNISPFFAKMLLLLKGKWGQANILVYLIAALITTGSLKKTLNKNTHSIWKRSNDILTYVQILYIYELQLQKTKKGQGNQIPVHKSSINEEEFTMFGNLYNEYKPKPKLLLSQMPLNLIAIELDIQQHFINKCLDNVKKIRNNFKLKFMEYEKIQEQVPDVLEIILKNFDNAAVYTGSRRFGYKMKSTGNYLLSKQNLFSIFNERPNLILPIKLLQKQGKQPQIILSSKISEEEYLMIVGEIPVCSQKSSFGDTQVEFTGVSNSLFESLWSSSFVQEFQNKHGCIVEPNRQIASIIIFCSKQTREVIQNQFKQFLEKTKSKLQVETKIDDYNVWKLVFQKGGSIRQLLNKNDFRVISLQNLPVQSTVQEVRELLEDYADLENIQLKDQVSNKTKTAIITFCSTADLRWAVDQLDHTFFNSKRIRFLKLQKNIEDNKIVSQNSVIFKWYAWPLTKKRTGIVIFKTNEIATKIAQVFLRPFDGKQVKAVVKQNAIHLQGLSEQTDEIYLSSHLGVFGQVQDVQLQKLPTQEPNNSQNLIQYYIKEFTTKDERFQICYVNKMSNGLRVAKVRMYNIKSIPVLCNALNQSKDLMGKTRLYIQPRYTHPILIPDVKMERLYQDLLSQSIKELGIDINSINIKKKQLQKFHYLIIKSTKLDAVNLVVNLFNKKLNSNSIQLSSENKQIYFSDMGKELLNRVEQQYTCKFVIDYANKKLGVISKPGDYESIVGQLIVITSQSLEDIVTCSVKTYKNFCKNTEKLQQIRKNNCLQEIRIDHIAKSIFIKGRPYHLKTARQALLYYLQSIHDENSDGVGAESCGICCQYLNRPYRLQICGHAFCEQCLMFSINNAFGDITCFPIKCPHCLMDVAIQDLISLLDKTGWNKMTSIAINDFVNKNGGLYSFCFTANCKGIWMSKQLNFDCPVCLKSYCTQCKMDYHPGLTCRQAQDGGEALLKKYMEQNDVRICPNPACKMLMQRIDGCYRVTCSRCNQSICFKCPRDNMLIFPTAQECYKHLTDMHGGYW